MCETQMRDQRLRCWYEKLEKIVKLNDLKNEHLLIYLHDLLVNKTNLAPDLPLIQNIRKNRTQSNIAHPSIFTATRRLINLLLQSVPLPPFCRLVTKIFSTSFELTSASIATNLRRGGTLVESMSFDRRV